MLEEYQDVNIIYMFLNKIENAPIEILLDTMLKIQVGKELILDYIIENFNNIITE